MEDIQKTWKRLYEQIISYNFYLNRETKKIVYLNLAHLKDVMLYF